MTFISCLGENTEKYITFTFSIEKKVTRIDKNVEEITKNISYILQLVNNLSEEFIELNVNMDMMIKNVRHKF